jgi:hypothetical protein
MGLVSIIKICEKNPLGLSCLLDFCYISDNFWLFVFALMYAVELRLYTFTYHTEHVITLDLHQNDVLFCMSCCYHSHLIIPYLAQVLGLWVICGVKMMSLCHG